MSGLRTFAWLTALLVCTAGSPSDARALKTKAAQLEAIQDTLDHLPLLQEYKDVPSVIDCDKGKDALAKTVCQDFILKKMALLYNRSQAYDYANYSKSDTDNLDNYRAPSPPCGTSRCVYNPKNGSWPI